MPQHPWQKMSPAMRLVAGLVLFGVPLAAQDQPQQPPRRGNAAISRVPAPPAGRFSGLAQRPPQRTPPPSVAITFDRNPVRVGEPSVVTLDPAKVVTDSPYVFTVAFGDGDSTPIVRGRADVAHVYRTAGSYMVSVTASTVPGTEVFVVAPVVSNNNTSIRVDNIELRVTPNTSTTREAVAFSTEFQSNDANIRYRFTFGDGTSSDWLAAPQTQHVFRRPGSYPNNYVEVGRSIANLPAGEVSTLARSAPVPVQVAAAQVPVPPRPGPGPAPVPVPIPVPPDDGTNIWPYAVVILAALAILGYSAKHWLSSPRVKLEPHRDPHALSQVVDGRGLAVDVEVRLHRAVSAGEIRSGPGDAGLVTAVRRTHG
jgi:PKD domain-containing protein